MHLTRNETEKCVMARIVRQKKLHQKNFTLKQFGTWTKHFLIVLRHCLVTDMGVHECHLRAGVAQHLHDRMQPCASFSQFSANGMAKPVSGDHRPAVLIDEAGLQARSF